MRIELLRNYIVNQAITLTKAMKILDCTGKGILFILDENERLMACMTDGDIRRFILSGGDLTSLALSAANPHPVCAHNFAEAQNILYENKFEAVPIIDDKGKLVDICSENDSTNINKKPLNVPVVINAGGKGTRLDPFTRILPKPLIPVGSSTIIELIIREYLAYNCDKFHIIVNYKRELIKAYFNESDNHYNITWYDEDEPLGTGGGLSLLHGKLDETFFFANCDTLLTINYEEVLNFHKNNDNAITMICADKNINIPYGVVDVYDNGLIKEMKEKPLIKFLTNTGVYIVEPDVIQDIKINESIGFPDIVETERKKGRKVAAYPISENDWMDMGQLPELEKMRIKLYGT